MCMSQRRWASAVKYAAVMRDTRSAMGTGHRWPVQMRPTSWATAVATAKAETHASTTATALAAPAANVRNSAAAARPRRAGSHAPLWTCSASAGAPDSRFLLWSSHKTANHESIRRARSPRDPPSVEGGHPRRVRATKGVRPRPRAQILRDRVSPLLPELPVSMVPVLLRLSLIPPKTPQLRWVCVAVSPLKRPPRMPNHLYLW